MSKEYFSIPLFTRLQAWKRGDKTKLGGHWHDPPYDPKNPKASKWFYVPTGCQQPSGCWDGEPFKLDGSATELRWCSKVDDYWRNVTPAHEVIKLGHTGWYVDSFQSDTTHGLVLQMRGFEGRPMFAHGIADPWNPGSAMIAWRSNELTDDKEDAARWADKMAEHYAESCREDEAKQAAETATTEARERIKEIRIELRSLIADTRESGDLKPRICDAVRAELNNLRAESRSLYKRIKEVQDNHWNAI